MLRSVVASMAVVTIALLALALLPATALAATITVNETADELNNDGDCSLREAIQAANDDAAVDACAAGSGDDTITLRADTYTLSLAGAGEDTNATGDLDIRSNIAINGDGASTTIIDGGAIDSVLNVLFETTLALNGVTVTNGSTGNGVTGAGIYNFRGTLILTNSTVTANASGDNGGGIYSLIATTTLTNSTVSNNTSQFDGAGIHIVDGSLTLINSTVTANVSGDQGGGIYNDGTLNMTDSTVSGNTAEFGGGIYAAVGTLNMTGSTVSGNAAGTAGGGIFANAGTLSITNSTLSGNTAGSSGGGAVANSQAMIALLNSTVSGNASSPNITFGGNTGGALRGDTNATYTFKNTIVANSTGGDCFGAGTFTTLGHNIDSDNTCSLTDVNDQPGVNPVLGPLADNGGLTATHALLSGSPALNAGDDAAAPATDQRGVIRPQGSASDIGAFELGFLLVPSVSAIGLLALAALTFVLFVRRARGARARA